MWSEILIRLERCARSRSCRGLVNHPKIARNSGLCFTAFTGVSVTLYKAYAVVDIRGNLATVIVNYVDSDCHGFCDFAARAYETWRPTCVKLYGLTLYKIVQQWRYNLWFKVSRGIC